MQRFTLQFGKRVLEISHDVAPPALVLSSQHQRFQQNYGAVQKRAKQHSKLLASEHKRHGNQ